MTVKQQEEIESIIESEGFWYALTDGGYLKLDKILKNKKDIEKVEDAISTLRNLEAGLSILAILNE